MARGVAICHHAYKILVTYHCCFLGKAMKIYFMTFANEKGTWLHPPRFSVRRIMDEAKASGYFDIVMGCSEKDLTPSFWARHQQFIVNHPRGFGYWLWRPQLVWQVMQDMNDGDVLCFADAGCTIRYDTAAKKRMAHYIKMVNASPHGVLSFQTRLLEKHWTKNDLLIKLNADSKIKNSGQLLGGVWFLKKSPASLRLVETWLRVASDDYHAIDDSPSLTANDKGFKEHRHDQSIFSILRKQMGTATLSDETDPRQKNNHTAPLLATRLYKKYWWRFLPKLWDRYCRK